MTSLLEFEDVHVRYGNAIAALHGVSLTVGAGDFVALLGANGAGKTTLLRAASNLLPAERGAITRGRIRFDGRDVTRHAPDAHLRAGLVPVLEGRRLFRSLSIEENLVIGALGRGFGRRATAQGLERVYDLFPRLKSRRHSVAGLTSGGEQQMAAIGRGLMADPRLFLLDEPSMGLAPQIVAEIFAALSRLNSETGLTLLVAEQNSAITLRHARHITVIENGRSVISGPAAEIAHRPEIRDSYLGAAPAPAVTG